MSPDEPFRPDLDAPSSRTLLDRPLCDHVDEVAPLADVEDQPDDVRLRCLKLADVLLRHPDGRVRAYCPEHNPLPRR